MHILQHASCSTQGKSTSWRNSNEVGDLASDTLDRLNALMCEDIASYVSITKNPARELRGQAEVCVSVLRSARMNYHGGSLTHACAIRVYTVDAPGRTT